MKRIHYIIFAGMLSVTMPLSMQAQSQPNDSTLSRTVVVEQEYNPNITDAAKINVVPQVEAPVVTQSQVEYDTKLLPATDIPASDMRAYARDEKMRKATPGYVRLGYGNYGNLDVYADYLFKISSKDRLSLTVGMDGMNGSLDMPGDAGQWDSYYYRTRAGADYRHSFRNVDLDVAGHFGLSNFNYLPASVDRKQKLTSGDVHLGIKSTSDEFPLDFCAETNLLLYGRQYELDFADAQEVIVRTKADVSGLISAGQHVGVAFAMDNVFYRNNRFEDYTSLEMNPYYMFKNESWKLRLGANVDLGFGFGKQFRVSPDVAVDYNFAKSFVLYAQAGGGRIQNDFRRFEAFSPYGQVANQFDATYEQLNAALGIKAGFLSGFRFNLYGGYQNLKNDLYAATSNSSEGQFLGLSVWDTNNLYAGAELGYDYKGIVSFSAYGILRKWSADGAGEDNFVLSFKPSAEGNIKVEVRPLQALHVQVGFLRITRGEYAGVKAEAVNNLYLSGSYEFLKGVSAYVRANNLLNKSYQYYWGYPAEGVNFVGGVSFRF